MIFKYLNYRKAIYLIFISFIVFEVLVLSLVHIEASVIEYLALIWLSLVIGFGIFDFMIFNNHYRNVINLKNSIEDSMESIFKANNVLEREYHDLIKQLYTMNLEIKHINLEKYQSMINYYTIWVHQTKTPISALKLLVQSEGNNQEMAMELLKIEQYVNMVLQYLRLDDINNDFSFEHVSLDKLVSDVLKKQVTFFAHDKINLEYKIDDTKVLTDEKWSSFVIEQVLSNAIKYTKQGTISIYNDATKLYIQDTGVGIKAEDLPRVFERGFTGFQGRKDKKASGIGLYLVKLILDKLNQGVTIESIVGTGTTVCIDFYKRNIFIE